MSSAQDRVKILASIMMAIFLAAIDVTIVNTAMPTIVGALGGLHLYSWVFSAYMLTSTVTVPVYGRLADTFGRKFAFTLGAGIYLLGSVFCGSAQSMLQLILFRGLQGLGAGAMIPITQTIIGDLYTPQERARVQGLFSSVWGFAALIGPAAGGLVTDYAGWRWIFLLKIPVGLTSIAMLWLFLKEKVEHRTGRIDYLGASTLVLGMLGVLFAVLQGGVHFAWGSPVILVSLLGGVALLTYFWRHEVTTSDPLIPLGLLKIPMIAVATLASLMVGAVLTGLAAYMPLYAQGVLGGTATAAGMVLAPLSLGWTLGSIMGGRVMLKLGIRASAIAGLAIQTAGTLVMVYFTSVALAPKWVLMLVAGMVGLGMGFASLAFIVGVQNSVGWSARGAATALNLFVRNLGSTVGVSLMGTALNLRLASAIHVGGGAGGGGDLQPISRVLEPELWATLSPEALASLREALASGLGAVYWIIFAAALSGLVLTFFLPKGEIQEAK